MQTRTQFLSSLAPLSELPEDLESECPICSDDFIEPVAVCDKHIFCKSCITKWLSGKKCNTCAICRRVLFELTKPGRWPTSADKVRTLALAMNYSGVLTDDFDTYDCRRQNICDIHKAAAEANEYLAADDHPPVTGEGKAIVDVDILEPHIIAMGNMLEGYACASGRIYLIAQHRDWKMIVERVHRFLSVMNGWVFEGDELVHMAKDLKLATLLALRDEKIDVRASGFFQNDAPLDSPSGDLDLFLDYIVDQCVKTGQLVDEYRAAQQDALENKKNVVGRVLRWTRQRFFGGI